MPEGDNRARVWFWALVTLFALLYCVLLGARPLMTPDEGRYAEISREMLVSGDWITPRLDGYLYFEKPPLQYWATALCFALFGPHEWSARLWSALMYLAAGAAIGWCGLRLYGRDVASLAVLCYLGMGLPFVLGQVETLDSGVAAFLTIALCAFCVAQGERAAPRERVAHRESAPAREAAVAASREMAARDRTGRGAMLLCWAAMGGAMLSKGLIGVVLPGAALFLYLLVTRQWRLVLRMQWAAGLALFAILVVPWFVLVSGA